jgi:hypothetical protein
LYGTGATLLRMRTALHSASAKGHTETATALVAAGADVRFEDSGRYDGAWEESFALLCRLLTRHGRALDVQADCT